MRLINQEFVQANNEAEQAFVTYFNGRTGENGTTANFYKRDGTWYSIEQKQYCSIPQMCEVLNGTAKYLESQGYECQIAMMFSDDSTISPDTNEATPVIDGETGRTMQGYDVRVNTLRKMRGKNVRTTKRAVNTKRSCRGKNCGCGKKLNYLKSSVRKMF